MKKHILGILSGLLLVIVGSIAFMDYPVILNGNQKEVVLIRDKTQIVFNPLEYLSPGTSVAYLRISKSDLPELPKNVRQHQFLKCNDSTVLQAIKENFLFGGQGGDMATCESEMYVYDGEKLIFHSTIVITDSVIGIQNSKSGWAEALRKEHLEKAFSEFKPVRKPLVWL
jgi:hypothetical protein